MTRPILMPPHYDERKFREETRLERANWKHVSEQIASGYFPKVYAGPGRREERYIGELKEAYERDGVYYLVTDTNVVYFSKSDRGPVFKED